jgi:GxxExxY protein
MDLVVASTLGVPFHPEGDDMDPILLLADTVRETSFELHTFLRHGHFERVYENGLVHRLRKKGIVVRQQHALEVCDEDGTCLGNYIADLFVEDELIVEVKAERAISSADLAQVLGYLRGCRRRHGMLVNFGAPRLEVRKLIL